MIEIQRIADQCTRCLLCVQECVSGVWREVDGEPRPVFPQMCNACGHCLAVCPADAVRHSLLDETQVRRVNRKLLDPEGYAEIIISRRSIRRYKDQPVAPETIEKIIDLVRYSPTASNTQNVAYTVVTNRAVMDQASAYVFGFGLRLSKWAGSPVGKALLTLFKRTGIVRTLNRYLRAMDYYQVQAKAGRDYILHNAPVLILISTPKGAAFGPDNCNIAGTNMMNYAHALGLGACYIGFLVLMLKRSRKLRRLLQVPDNRRVHVALVLGHPAYAHASIAYRKRPAVKWLE
jgi:nitroreductase/NAD-dependent dihydropyrimidine dehydrogenase PreA subunit